MRLLSVFCSFLICPLLFYNLDMLARSAASLLSSRRDCILFGSSWCTSASAAQKQRAGGWSHSNPARMATVAHAAEANATVQAVNVLGTPLKCCCSSPVTGYYRDGFCRTGGGDFGVHVVCAQVTEEFLEYTRAQGNDLSTPAPHYNFPGLKPGDRWCLCASRWKEAADAGKAPPVVLSGCHIRALDYVDLDLLKKYAVEEDQQHKQEL